MMKYFLLTLSLSFMFFPFPSIFDSFTSVNEEESDERVGNVIWDIKTEEKIIAFTFDDGPDPLYTERILDILAEHEAKATFFVLGNQAEQYPDILIRQLEEGHEVGNHTYSHPYKATSEQLELELKKTDDIIRDITGEYPLYYRPVGGHLDDDIISTAVHNGLRVILWSLHLDTQDWKRPGVDKITKKVLSGARPGDIVLFHDGGGDRTQTVKALEKLIPKLKKEGYQFVTISELIERTGIEVTE